MKQLNHTDTYNTRTIMPKITTHSPLPDTDELALLSCIMLVTMKKSNLHTRIQKFNQKFKNGWEWNIFRDT